MFTALTERLSGVLQRLVGRGVQEVNRLLEQFQQMRKFLQRM